MLAYVRKFTYLGAAKNSNKEYLPYGKGVSKYLKSIFPPLNLLISYFPIIFVIILFCCIPSII